MLRLEQADACTQRSLGAVQSRAHHAELHDTHAWMQEAHHTYSPLDQMVCAHLQRTMQLDMVSTDHKPE